MLFVTVLVISDTHGRSDRIRRLLSHVKGADALIFLGDGLADLDEATADCHVPVLSVRGNCDFFAYHHIPLESTVTLEGVRIYLHHGHETAVKRGIGGALARATSENADICLFGHTHEAHLSYADYHGDDRRICLFNPGSLGRSYDGQAHYGILTVKDGAYLLSHGVLP